MPVMPGRRLQSPEDDDPDDDDPDDEEEDEGEDDEDEEVWQVRLT